MCLGGGLRIQSHIFKQCFMHRVVFPLPLPQNLLTLNRTYMYMYLSPSKWYRVLSIAFKKLVLYEICLAIQWNPSKMDTIGTKNFVRCSEVSLVQGLVGDHALPTIVAGYDKVLLWTTKKTILMRDLSTDSS